MKKIVLMCLFGLVLCNYNSSDEIENEKKLVKEVYSNYKTAILNDRGKEAIKYLDNATLEYYGYIAEQSLEADKAVLDSMNIIDKIMILTIRARATKDEILSFDKESILIYAIDNGMVGKGTIQNRIIDNIIINNDNATASIFVNEEISPNGNHYFKKENGMWKINLTNLTKSGIEFFEKNIEESGLDTYDFLFLIFEKAMGIKLDDSIFNPINK